MNDLNIIVGDCREEMAKLPEQSVQCVVTSPPYWGQRDYGTANFIGGNDPECDHAESELRRGINLANSSYSTRGGAKKIANAGYVPYKTVCQKCGATRTDNGIGLEADVHEWIDSMVEVFRGVWRVLRDDGTVWLNLGDKYASTWAVTRRSEIGLPAPDLSQRRNTATTAGVKEKDLIGLPWRLAFALQDDGWYLRRDIIWHKPNPMPESATDRPSTAHEYIFLLTKQPRYFFDMDAVRSPHLPVSIARASRNSYANEGRATATVGQPQSVDRGEGTQRLSQGGRSLRSVWKIATQSFGGDHYATYPEKLVEPCIKAGSREGDTVLDPFSGAGTTGLVAMRLGRSYTGIELNPEYAAMSRKRIVERVGATSPDALKPDEQAQGRLI